MKALTLAFLFTAFCLPYANAQIADRTETNCDGESRSVYGVGDAGRPLIIASKGFDCGICIGQAPAIAAFATEYAGEIEVWGAMRFKYSQATPTCANIDTWNTNHGWDDVFMFLDLESYWVATGFPNYRLIHPTTHEVVYQGPSFTTAANQAISLLNSLSVGAPSKADQFRINYDNGTLRLFNPAQEPGPAQLTVYNLAGQPVASYSFDGGSAQSQHSIPLNVRPGIYVARLRTSQSEQAIKFTVF